MRVSEKLAYDKELAMSMGFVGGIANSAAGAPLSQTAGSETERAQKESLAQHREIDSNQRSERAAGIGQTEQDQESSERDADGRRLWEAPAKRGIEEPPTDDAAAQSRQSKDPSGQSGTKLDLTG
jgi:hypothetical protein